MKHLLTSIILFLSFSAFAQNTDEGPQTFEEYLNSFVGKQLGQFKIKTSDSTTFSNADLSGKITFVNFWFASCPPCMAEMEGLSKLYDTLKNNTNFAMVSFTFEPRVIIKWAKKKYQAKYNMFHISKEDCSTLHFRSGYPTSFIVDKNGVIIHALVGGAVNEADATKEIMAHVYPIITWALAQNATAQ